MTECVHANFDYRLELLALAHNEKGEVLYRMVEFDLAISEFDMALTYNQRLPAAFYNRGLIHYRMGMTTPYSDSHIGIFVFV